MAESVVFLLEWFLVADAMGSTLRPSMHVLQSRACFFLQAVPRGGFLCTCVANALHYDDNVPTTVQEGWERTAQVFERRASSLGQNPLPTGGTSSTYSRMPLLQMHH
jgi:hypothetical protein